jgi:hypothetical protein
VLTRNLQNAKAVLLLKPGGKLEIGKFDYGKK